MLKAPRSPSSVCDVGLLDPRVEVGPRTSGSVSVPAVSAVMIDEAKDCTREARLIGSASDGEEALTAAFCSSG